MRVKRGYVLRRRHNRWLKLAKGYYGSRHTLWKTAHESVVKALRYSYDGRKHTKRNFRKLWISRISASCKLNNTSYSQFMHGLKLANVNLNRKMLSEMAINDPKEFTSLVELSNKALGENGHVVDKPSAANVSKVNPKAGNLPVKTKVKTVDSKKVAA